MAYAVFVVEVEHAMNKRIQAFLLVTALLGILPGAVASDRWETLRAINLVENPTNQTHMGSRGELGPYQFRVSTWRMHTQKPFNMAIDRAAADEVAVSHYEWIKRGLETAGIDANTYNIAMAWNCGLGAVVGGRVPTESYRYADQVSNLVHSFEQRPAVEVVVYTHPTQPKPAQSEFQVQFAGAAAQPRFVVVTDADAPQLVVMTEAPRFVIAPATLRFSLAIAD
jgi:hypothetical protein